MRTVIIRILLVALVGVAVFSIISRVASTGNPVEFRSLGVNDLEQSSFSVSVPARIAIDAVGSFEETGVRGDTVLAAYGWIVRRSDGEVVWRMRPTTRPARGSLAFVADTLVLQPGTYDAFFASYGDPLVRNPRPPGDGMWDRFRSTLSRGGRAWHGEADRWHFLALGVNQEDRDAITVIGRETAGEEDGATSLVRTERTRSNQRESTILRVTEPTTLRIRALGESYQGIVGDGASIIRLSDADTVWTFTESESAWAGGSVRNRVVNATVEVEPGLYQVDSWTNDSHAYRDWDANPPFAPWMWGLRVSKASANAGVVVFDTTDPTLEAITRFDCPGSDADLRDVLTLTEQTMVVITATGEITDSQAYDTAFLYQGIAPLESNAVWTLEDAKPTSAGGNSKNKTATEVIVLEPGTYLLRYISDDVYDCADDYNGGDGPDNGFWGVALFAADPSFDPGTVRRERQTGATGASGGSADSLEAPNAVLAPNDIIVKMSGLGNDANVHADFSIDEDTMIRIVAVGELLPSERLDYGWLEDENGETVWDMTRENTRPAGGDAKNRRFDGRIELGAGRYTAHFVTNGRHSFGAFDGAEPKQPSDWGLTIARSSL